MNLQDLDIKEIIVSMPDLAYLTMRLAPQEVGRVVSVLYEGLQTGLEKTLSQNIKDPDLAFKIFYEEISKQLISIETDLAITKLTEKFDINLFLQKVFV